jgi:Protein of unknown function (DUF3703)
MSPSNEALRAAWLVETAAATQARREEEQALEWAHLERAHILSQPMAGRHVRTHLAMLAAGWRRRDMHEITGQLMRLVVAGPGSVTGRYPAGNTGGADVSAFRPMFMPEELAALLGAGSAAGAGWRP